MAAGRRERWAVRKLGENVPWFWLTFYFLLVIKPTVSKQAGQMLLKVKALMIQSSQNLCFMQVFGSVSSGWSTESWQRAQRIGTRSEMTKV